MNTKNIENKQETITANIPVIEKGESVLLTNLDGNYVVSEIEKNKSSFENYIDLSNYDARKMEHLYDRLLENETTSYMTTSDELASLAKNTQSNIDKIVKINGIVKYNINKNDIVGRLVEVIENNLNTNYSINFPTIKSAKKKELKMLEEMKDFIKGFNEDINIESLIRDCVISSYVEGNFVFYLKGSSEKGFGYVKYPLKIVEITERNIDGEPIVAFNVRDLKSKLKSSVSKFGKMKAKQKIDIQTVIDEEVKRDYPSEVYDAYLANDQYVYLDPARVGVVRINNLGGKYGLTPIFKCLDSLLTLETIDNADRKTIQSKSKKIIHQKMRSNGLNDKGGFDTNAIGYAQASLIQAMSNDIVVYTSNPLVESLEYIESKAELTDYNTVLYNRNRALDALGISFTTNSSKNGANTVSINYQDLLKTINKIVRELEKVINKLYRTALEEAGFLVEYAPKIKIQSTSLLDLDSCMKLVDLLYSKIGASYETVYNALGMDVESEVERRKRENDMGYDELFKPHGNSYTSNSNDLITNTDVNDNGSKKSNDTDKSLEDKARNKTKV